MKLIHSNVYRLPFVPFALYSRCSHLGLDLVIVCHASYITPIECNGDSSGTGVEWLVIFLCECSVGQASRCGRLSARQELQPHVVLRFGNRVR
jgi:hypothetical protein